MIDGTTSVTYRMVFANFSLYDKYGRDRFFDKIFLVANTNMKVVLGIPFLSLSNIDIRFAERELK